MRPPLSRIEWPKSVRIVPSRYPPVGLFDRVADQADLEAVFEIEGMTNDRIRDQLGEIHLVPEDERIRGPGTTPVMAAFTHPNVEGSRFSDGAFGVYYAADGLETAIAETRFHRERFLRFSSEPPMRIEMRAYYAKIEADLHDLRDSGASNPEWFNPEPSAYGASQALGSRLRQEGSFGVIYHSVRRPVGESVGIFRPRAINPVRQGPHFVYLWNGDAITDVLQVKRTSEV